MKTLFQGVLAILLFINSAYSQTTYDPSCYSNAHGWSITKIEVTDSRTYVYLNFYSYESQRFYFNKSMYIENYNNQFDSKIYIRSVLSNDLETIYTLQANTEYNFILEFDKIPYSWTDINIKEPYVSSSVVSWYWKYISLNKPSTSRLPIENFLRNSGINFLAGAAHPLNTYKSYRYNIDYDEILLTLYYYNDYHTDLKITKVGDFFSKIRIVDDNDCMLCYPFSSLEFLKNLAFDQSNYETYSSQIERFLGKYINDMDGREVASLLLSLMWLAYK
jgi:hypothetical protein